jgi:DNA-binding transcriptional LysR family regulator
MLDVRRLRLLRELSARGTIAAVAEALSYSPSAVSQQLSLLEREAGVPLLERGPRSVRLTAAAMALVAHAEVVLARVEEAEAELEAMAEQVSGTVRVATIQSAGLYLLAPVVRRLAGEHPALRVEVSEIEPEVSLRALALGGVDLVLGDEYPFLPWPRDPRLDVEPLLKERFRLILPREHPLAESNEPVSLAALRDEPWAAGRADSHFGELTVRTCRSLGGFEPDVRHRSNDLLMLLALVASGQAVTLLPELVRAEREPGAAVCELAERVTRTVFGAIRHGSARRPAFLALRSALRETAARLQLEREVGPA